MGLERGPLLKLGQPGICTFRGRPPCHTARCERRLALDLDGNRVDLCSGMTGAFVDPLYGVRVRGLGDAQTMPESGSPHAR